MSARPSEVKGILKSDLPRPRDFAGDDFLALRKETLGLLEEEVQKEIKLDGL
jgi:hypothetical protein